MEGKRRPWLNYLSLTTVVLAVCAMQATFKAGGYSTRSVLLQNQASDQWAYFQVKSIKEYLYELQHEKLKLEFAALKRQSPRASFSSNSGIGAHRVPCPATGWSSMRADRLDTTGRWLLHCALALSLPEC